jgi:hypothetical protein
MNKQLLFYISRFDLSSLCSTVVRILQSLGLATGDMRTRDQDKSISVSSSRALLISHCVFEAFGAFFSAAFDGSAGVLRFHEGRIGELPLQVAITDSVKRMQVSGFRCVQARRLPGRNFIRRFPRRHNSFECE